MNEDVIGPMVHLGDGSYERADRILRVGITESEIGATVYFVIALPPSEEGVIFGADYDTREDAKSFIRVFLRNVAEATSNAKERTT